MDYKAIFTHRQQSAIDNDPTIPLLKLASEGALMYGLVDQPTFKQRLFAYIPHGADTRKIDRYDRDIIKRFEVCFRGIDYGIPRRAQQILNETDEPCNGIFTGWSKAARATDPAVLKQVLTVLLSATPLDGIRELLSRYNGRVPGFRKGLFSQLCYLTNNSLFPNIRNHSNFPKVLFKEFNITTERYGNYPDMAEELNTFLDGIGFPRRYRYRYFDMYFGDMTKKQRESKEKKAFDEAFAGFVERVKEQQLRAKFRSEDADMAIIRHKVDAQNDQFRAVYFEAHQDDPYTCQVCGMNLSRKYKLKEKIITVHNKLIVDPPVDPEPTDLVGLCPNCHEALHQEVRSILIRKNMNAFATAEAAREAFDTFAAKARKAFGITTA